MPHWWAGEYREREAVIRVVSAKLGLDDGKPSWQLAGRRPQVVFTRGCPPPDLVTLGTVARWGKTEATVLEHIKAAQWHELLWGVGTYNGVVSTSINTESPHTGLSQPSGTLMIYGPHHTVAALDVLALALIPVILWALWHFWVQHWDMFYVSRETLEADERGR